MAKVIATEFRRVDFENPHAPFKQIGEKETEVADKDEFLKLMERELELGKRQGYEIKHTSDKDYFVFRLMFHGIFVYQIDYIFTI